MIKLIPHAEDATERLSTDNTKDVGHAGTPKPRWEDVNKNLIFLNKKDDGWACKTRSRRGEGTGRMSHMKDVARR